VNDVPFHITVMGRRFYEAQLPKLIAEIERLGDELERIGSVASTNVPTGAMCPDAATKPPVWSQPGAPLWADRHADLDPGDRCGWVEGAIDAGIEPGAVPQKVEAEWIASMRNAFWNRVAWSCLNHGLGPLLDLRDAPRSVRFVPSRDQAEVLQLNGTRSLHVGSPPLDDVRKHAHV
jgi:hypothetical protein